MGQAKPGKRITVNNDYGISISIQELFFFAFFILLSITKGLGLYEGQKLFELLTAPALLCGLIKLVVTPYTKRQWIMQAVLLVLTAVTYYHSRERGILFLAFLVLGMKNISVKRVFHVGLWVWSVCAVMLGAFSFFRLEHTIYRVHDKMGLGHIFRWSLGFTHPNILHITYLALCALVLYELGDRYNFKHFIYLMTGNLLVFFYSVSYTGFGIVAVLLTGCLYVRFRPKFWIFEKFAANCVLPVILILSFYIPVRLFEGKYTGFYQQLNFALNMRLYLARQFLVPDYISLFGVDVSRVVKSSMTMDNSYVWGLINYGVVTFAVIMTGYLALIGYDTWKQKTRELIMLVCFLGAGWTEPLLFNTSFKNVTLIFLGAFLFRQKEGAEEHGLFPKLPEQVHVPFAGLPDYLWAQIKGIFKAQKKKMVTILLAGAVAGALLCAVIYREPEGYVVQRFYTDGQYETPVYLESGDDPDYEGYRIMNYKDKDTPMQIVSGRAVKLETARYYLGSILLGAFTAAVAGSVVFGYRKRQKYENG